MFQLLFKGKIILRANAHWAWSSLLRLRIYFAFSKLLWESGTWWLTSFIMNSHQRSISKKYTTHCNLADCARFRLCMCLCEFRKILSNDDFFSNTNKKIRRIISWHGAFTYYMFSPSKKSIGSRWLLFLFFFFFLLVLL